MFLTGRSHPLSDRKSKISLHELKSNTWLLDLWEGNKTRIGGAICPAADGTCRREGNGGWVEGRGGHQHLCSSPRTGSGGEGFILKLSSHDKTAAIDRPRFKHCFQPLTTTDQPPVRSLYPVQQAAWKAGTSVWSCYTRWWPDFSWARAHAFRL